MLLQALTGNQDLHILKKQEATATATAAAIAAAAAAAAATAAASQACGSHKVLRLCLGWRWQGEAREDHMHELERTCTAESTWVKRGGERESYARRGVRCPPA